MAVTKSIFITTAFPAVHQWPDCPFEEVSYLRNPHRHVFHVKVSAQVTHDNRDIEFILLKQDVDWFLSGWWGQNIGSLSCEMMAAQLMDHLLVKYPTVYRVVVSEDDENGAVVERTPNIPKWQES